MNFKLAQNFGRANSVCMISDYIQKHYIQKGTCHFCIRNDIYHAKYALIAGSSAYLLSDQRHNLFLCNSPNMAYTDDRLPNVACDWLEGLQWGNERGII